MAISTLTIGLSWICRILIVGGVTLAVVLPGCKDGVSGVPPQNSTGDSKSDSYGGPALDPAADPCVGYAHAVGDDGGSADAFQAMRSSETDDGPKFQELHDSASTTALGVCRVAFSSVEDSVKWDPRGANIFASRGPRLHVVAADGSSVREVARAINASTTETWGNARVASGPTIAFDVAPNGTQIVYSSCVCARTPAGRPDQASSGYDSGLGELVVAESDGTDRLRLTRNRVGEHYPMWSPDGSRIAFAGNAGGLPFPIGSASLYTMASDGSDVRAIQLGDRIAMRPAAWSPDGRRIAFVGRDDGSGRAIYVVDADDGSDPLRFRGVVSGPAWSPDGQRLAFVKPEEDALALFVFAADGSGARRLATIPDWQRIADARDPADVWIRTVAWSPGGTKILVLANQGVTFDRYADRGAGALYVVGADDGDLTRVGVVDFRDHVRYDVYHDAAWSPDGSRIAVLGEFDATPISNDPTFRIVLFTMASDGTDLRFLAGQRSDGKLEPVGSS